MEVDGSFETVYIYLDSSMLVALANPDDMHRDDALRVLRAIVRSGCKMITSLLAVMEAVAAVRRRIAGSHKCRSGSAEGMAGAGAHVQSMASRVAKYSYDMSKAGLLVVMDAAGRSPGLELLCGRVLGHAGRVVPVAKGDRFGHHGVGSCDWPHIWLALIAGAAPICAADKALAGIPDSGEEFGGIAVQPMSGPHQLVDLLARDPQRGAASRQGGNIGRAVM